MSKENNSDLPVVPQPAKHPAQPVPPSDSFYERLAAPLPDAQTRDGKGENVAEREARRLQHRLGETYVPESGADLTFDPRIAYAIALGLDSPSAVITKYGLTLEQGKELMALPGFIATVKKYKDEVATQGVSFRLKAKIQAEDLLTHSYILATDPEVPAAVRADLIKWTAKMAGLEPSEKGEKGGGVGSGFALHITFAGGAPQPAVVQGGHVIDVTPTKEG
jgi:hypothetical protein